MITDTCEYSFMIPDTVATCDPCHNWDLCKLVEYAKCKSVSLADKYVKLFTYGNHKAQEVLDRLLVIRSIIETLDCYYIPDNCDFTKGEVMNFKGQKICMSKNNSLYLGQKTQITPEEANCLTEDQVKLLGSRLEMLVFEC